MTARHTKQVASVPQVAQINLMRHQCTDLPASKHKKRKSFVKPRPPSHKNNTSDSKAITRASMSRLYTSTRRDVESVDIQSTLKVSSVQQRSFSACLVINMGTSQASVIRKNKLHSSQGNQRLICCKWVLLCL